MSTAEAQAPLQIESLFSENGPEIVDVRGIPTLSIPDSLVVVQAVVSDFPERPDIALIPKYALEPVREQSRAQVDSARADVAAQNIAVSLLDSIAGDFGFRSYGELTRSLRSTEGDDKLPKQTRRTIHNVLFGDPIRRLDDSFTSNSSVPTWNEFVDSYVRGIDGRNEEVMVSYLSGLKDQLRVNAALHFRHLKPVTWLIFEHSPEATDRALRVIGALDKYLVNSGYKPAEPNITVADS